MIPPDHAPPGEAASGLGLIEAGNRLEDAGDFEGALATYRKAVAGSVTGSPGWLRGLLNVGNALQRLGRTAEAIDALHTALRVDPDFAPARFNLGNVHLAAGNVAPAEGELREALRLDPTMSRAAIALANLLDLQQRPLEAEKQLREVLAATPDCAPAAYNLALLLQNRDDSDAAELLFRACIDADPTYIAAHTALGDLLRNAGRAADAEAWYRKGMAAGPGQPAPWSSMLLSYLNRDDLRASDIFAEHLRFGDAYPEPESARHGRRSRAVAHDRLRIGYLSGDFIQHPVALFLRPVLMHHDRAQFDVYCYSNNPKEDGMTRELRSHAGHWRGIADSDDATAAQRIRADDLDLLIDLSGHSARSRVLLFNRGCAPVQATWLGYLHSTGLRATDFRLCDRHTDPTGVAEAFNVETLVRLPDSQWCYAPVFDVPRVDAPRRDPSNGIVFGSFNHASKITDRCLDLWCRVLHAVPASVLRIHAAPQGRATTELLRRVAARGIDPGRISVHPRTPIDAYFAAIGDVDIALDTLPYNGGTTTFDVLWMEVPLVALAGERSVSRSGVSILSTLQMPELIAGSDDEYVALNARLSADAGWRHALRGSLRERMRQSPLMDAPRFTRNLEDAFRRMVAQSRGT